MFKAPLHPVLGRQRERCCTRSSAREKEPGESVCAPLTAFCCMDPANLCVQGEEFLSRRGSSALRSTVVVLGGGGGKAKDRD